MDQYDSAFEAFHNPETMSEKEESAHSSATIITCTITDLVSQKSQAHRAVQRDRATHPEGIIYENADTVLINPFTDFNIITISEGDLRLPVNSMMSHRKISTLKEIIFSRDGVEITKYSDFKVT